MAKPKEILKNTLTLESYLRNITLLLFSPRLRIKFYNQFLVANEWPESPQRAFVANQRKFLSRMLFHLPLTLISIEIRFRSGGLNFRNILTRSHWDLLETKRLNRDHANAPYALGNNSWVITKSIILHAKEVNT